MSTELDDKLFELLKEMQGSCSCMTKTPDIKFHKFNCKYRKLMLRYELLSAQKEKNNGKNE